MTSGTRNQNKLMKTRVTLLTVIVPFLMTTLSSSMAGDKMSDPAIKQQLLGYWKSPRHEYLIKSDGLIYMLPRKYATTTNRWDVKDGLFYWDGLPHEIITLNDKRCVYRSRDRNPTTFTLIRSTKAEADPE
jgi:hypothetical protein